MKGLCLSVLPSPTSIFRFFHLPLGQSLIFLPPFPLLPTKFFTNIREQKRMPLTLCTKATNSGLYHPREGGEMLMILPCHSQEPRELNDTPRSHSTVQARPTVLRPSPPSHSVLLHGLPWFWGDLPLPHGAKGLHPTEKSLDTEMTKTWRCC